LEEVKQRLRLGNFEQRVHAESSTKNANAAEDGSERELEHTRKKLNRSSLADRVVALWGLGGVGYMVLSPNLEPKLTRSSKSQIAITYVYWLHQQQLDVSIFWIHAATIDRFRQAYLEIAQKCQILGTKDPTADVLQLVKEWLEDEQHGKWLMVIDNADNTSYFFKTRADQDDGTEPPNNDSLQKKLGHYIPKCNHGSILVTTRNKEAAVKFADRGLVNVEKMSETESEDLISSVLTGEDYNSTDVKELGLLLDHLPLAIMQASCYIKETSSSIKRYIEIYRDSEDSALDILNYTFESDGRDRDIPNAVARSWMISFDQIREALPRAAKILSLMAFFDRQSIPESLLKDQDETLFSFEMAIGKLLAYSLVTRNVGNKHFDEHRLAHLISQAWMRRNGNEKQLSKIALGQIFERFPKEDYKDWDVCQSYLPHARAVIDRELKNTLGAYNQSINYLMGWLNRYLGFQGSYSSSVDICKQRLDYCSRHLGLEHADTLDSVNNLAMALQYQGQYKAAEELNRQALVGREKVLGPEHPDTLSSVNNLAMALRYQGQYKAAEELYRQALVGAEKLLGPDHPDTLQSIGNLAVALEFQGQYEAAEELYRLALAGREKALGLEHPDTLRSARNLAAFLRDQGKTAEA
jgi:tetratricopeptide (TPR) repeat protein